jgi:LssY C-terminus
MLILPFLFFLMNPLPIRQAPAGSQVHIRLTTTVGSYASRAGTRVNAVLIAPLMVDGETVLPAGSGVSGSVRRVARVGLGIRHETAALDLEFHEVALPGGDPVALGARVAEVDNARELVTRAGRIHGVRATDSASYRVSGYVRTLLFRCDLHATLAVWIVRAAVINLPEPEIYLPAGAELTLTLTEPLWVASFVDDQVTHRLPDDERADLLRAMASLPSRTHATARQRPSDLTNVALLGSRERISAAFTAAGWTAPRALSFRRRVQWLRAVGERHGFDSAPMSSLLLNGAQADMAWEKGLNDVSKRHHIRLWKQADLWDGQELWIGAATRDVDFGFLRPGRPFTHKIAAEVDQERDKVAYDLVFTGCTRSLEWAGRTDVPRVTENGTGDRMTTDTRLAVIELNDCRAPRLSTETVDSAPVPIHGGRLALFARREILSARSDLIRNNWYWRGLEATRWMVGVVRAHVRSSSGPRSFLSSFRPSVFQAPRPASAPIVLEAVKE